VVLTDDLAAVVHSLARTVGWRWLAVLRGILGTAGLLRW
jgi:hypothetical protein